MIEAWTKSILTRDAFLKIHAHPQCPNYQCGENVQIEIISKGIPAQWKCRICKTKFEHEPPTIGS